MQLHMRRGAVAVGLASAIVLATAGTARAEVVPHVAPATVPVMVAFASNPVTGEVNVSATSTAPSVQFLLDGVPFGDAAVPDAGTASVLWSTWGSANDVAHSWSAQDCSSGECNVDEADPIEATIDNAAPTLTSPAPNAKVSFNAAITASAAGGGVDFYIDGVEQEFDGTDPFSTSVGSLSEGAHTVKAQSCSADGLLCDGPFSDEQSFTVKNLHPTITSVTPSPFSPNGDGRREHTTVQFSLPNPQNVTFFALRAGDRVEVRHLNLGTLSTGTHKFDWAGKNNASSRVADGKFIIQLMTTKTDGSATLAGLVEKMVAVDTHAPGLSGLKGAGATLFPFPDGYADAFTPKVFVDGPAKLTLFIKHSGHVIRTISASHGGAGTFGLTWNGHNAAGATVPSGTYTFAFRAEDTAGNRHGTSDHTVFVRPQKLVSHTSVLTQNGDQGQLGSTDTSCAQASYNLSTFINGVWLVNTCPSSSSELVAGFYTFTLPAAQGYTSFNLESYGNSDSAPEPLIGAVRNGDASFTILHIVQLQTKHHNGWANYGGFGAGLGRVSNRHIIVSVGVPNSVQPEDYDVGIIRLTVTYKVLQ